MSKVQINYNPYTVKTKITINGKGIDSKVSPLAFTENKRLQEWIEPKGSWPGIFKALRNSTGDDELELDFIGTFGDFEDIAYAKKCFGTVCFEKIDLIHKNKETAMDADPYKKMQQLNELYKELQDGPVDEFKTQDIKDNFNAAVNSEFRIVIVAPMSSGKSTLINAIIGRDMLPAMNQATTAVITEIKENDHMDDFLVTADDKYGNSVVKNQKANKKVISELNDKKDHNDPEGKEALIHLIQLEGPIPELKSDVLSTVFVDTPGGNNSLNDKHEAVMDKAINDENKSLILYVLDGAHLSTNDGKIILQKIAKAMKDSTNGKQSRDRFVFVANRMDEFDVEKEPYDEVIQKIIIPQLASNGITEPNLFLASAKTAKLIRMNNAGEKLTETEKDELTMLVKRFNNSSRRLSQYASLPLAEKDKLMESAEKYEKAGKGLASSEEVEKNKNKAAEINSGLPAIERAIKEYLEKYAIAIKIKTVHDTFMNKVIERNMVDSCKAEWSASKDKFDAIKNELKEKKEKCNHSKKLAEFREKVDKIALDVRPIKEEQAKVNRRIDELVETTNSKVEMKAAQCILSEFECKLKKIGAAAQVALDSALNNGVKKTCQSIVEEYAEYIKELDSDGAFNVGNYDIKQTKEFEGFNIKKAEDVLSDEKYVSEESVRVGTKTVKKKGLINAIARIFGGGYQKVDVYEEQQFVDMKQLIKDQVTGVQHAFDKEINNAIKDTQEKVNIIKSTTIKKLEGLDEVILDLLSEIDKMLISQEELQAKVKENAEKIEWSRNFIQKVENLLTI